MHLKLGWNWVMSNHRQQHHWDDMVRSRKVFSYTCIRWLPGYLTQCFTVQQGCSKETQHAAWGATTAPRWTGGVFLMLHQHHPVEACSLGDCCHGLPSLHRSSRQVWGQTVHMWGDPALESHALCQISSLCHIRHWAVSLSSFRHCLEFWFCLSLLSVGSHSIT